MIRCLYHQVEVTLPNRVCRFIDPLRPSLSSHGKPCHFSSSKIPDKEYHLLASRLNGLDHPTVWHEFSSLATKYSAVNLGQGFPDWNPPSFVVESMLQAIDIRQPNNPNNQYARSAAHMPLANILSDIYTKRWKCTDRTIDPATQIATAVGCTQVLFCAIQGLVEPGEMVVLLEPAFDIYEAQVRMAGGIPIHVPLIRTDTSMDSSAHLDASLVFEINWEALQAALDLKPKVLILNTPHNPTGKVFTLSELERIASILHPETTIIADEVYEYILFDEAYPHISMATVCPDQTLTVSSSGKSFTCTGWKVGWAVGPAHLVQAVTAVQQWVNFSAPTPNQEAIARSLQWAQSHEYHNPDTDTTFASYYKYLIVEYRRKRGLLLDALRVAGMRPIVPQGAFFVMADTSEIDFPYERYQDTVTDAMPYSPMPRDWALARWMTETVGVTAIPPSSFYCRRNRSMASNLLRFAFCKTDSTLLQAHRCFEKYFGTS